MHKQNSSSLNSDLISWEFRFFRVHSTFFPRFW